MNIDPVPSLPALDPLGGPMPEREALEAAGRSSDFFEERQLAAKAVTPNLYRVDLPQGDVPGFAISRPGGIFEKGYDTYNPDAWLHQGYDGVRFVGKGIDKTHIRPQKETHEITVAVDNHNGIVEFDDCTIHTGKGTGKAKAIHFGLPKQGILPKWSFRANNVKFSAVDNGGFWLLFTYQASMVVKDCVFIGERLKEHDTYHHGLGPAGLTYTGNTFESAGADEIKVRSESNECDYSGPQTLIQILGNTFKNWRQTHSHRGGAAVDLQGTAAHVLLSDNVFYPGPGNYLDDGATRSKCIMVSSEGSSFDILTGKVGNGPEGFGTGWVHVRRCAMEASGPGKPWLSDEIMNCGRWGGAQRPAMGYLVEECGIWGENMIIRPNGGKMPNGESAVPYWSILNSNTARVVRFCQEHYGMKCEREASYFEHGVQPVSQDRPA